MKKHRAGMRNSVVMLKDGASVAGVLLPVEGGFVVDVRLPIVVATQAQAAEIVQAVRHAMVRAWMEQTPADLPLPPAVEAAMQSGLDKADGLIRGSFDD